MKNIDLEPLLDWIDPSCSHDDWIRVGMALKTEGYDFEVFKSWSEKSAEKYDPMSCYSAWKSFNKTGVTGATIVHMAKQNGWIPESNNIMESNGKYYSSSMKLDSTGYSGTITFEEVNPGLIIKDEGWLRTEDFFEPTEAEWNAAEDLKRYLQTVFDPDDIVAYNVNSRRNSRGKMAPYSKGSYTRSAQQIINDLDKYGNVEMAVGSYDQEGGAWIRINPFDGNGIDNSNVLSYKYTLVESDDMDISKQIALIKALKLPVAALVYSGGKSIHAVTHIDARNKKEYSERVNFLYETCSKNGLKVDSQNKNENRLSRMPGVRRGQHKQFLIDTDIGYQDYQSWADWVLEETDDLPDTIDFDTVWDNVPPKKEELITDMLRQSHIMIISGQSKVGKSYLMIELAAAIATGDFWCGKKCARGKVLYVNGEVDEDSCLNNILDVCKAKGYTKEQIAGNLKVWNLRGHISEIGNLKKSLFRRFKKDELKAVILDPTYKIFNGDESNPHDVSQFTLHLDDIANTLDTSVIYVHHYTKGSQIGKESIDRASGSGVFARHADCIVTVTKLESTEETKYHIPVRIEASPREFPKMDPVNMWFDHPIHILDDLHKLDFAQEKGAVSGEKAMKIQRFADRLQKTFDDMSKEGVCPRSMVIKALKMKPATFKYNYEQAVERGFTSLGYVPRDPHVIGSFAVIYDSEKFDPEADRLPEFPTVNKVKNDIVDDE